MMLKTRMTACIATVTSTACVFGLYRRNNMSSFVRQNNGQSHVTIHMDLNKTMIMSDAVQGLSFRQSINTILGDKGCYGNVMDFDPHNITHQAYKQHAISDKIWIPKLIETDKNKINEHNSTANADDKLISYGKFIRTFMPYTKNAVDVKIKSERLMLRRQFTDIGHPGHQFINIVDTLYDKLNDQMVMPAFWKCIDYLYARYRTDNNQSFSILFRTFGTDLHEVVELFNKYCQSKGYNELFIDWNDKTTHGVMIHDKGELYLVIGTVEIEDKYIRIQEGMTRESIENADRLTFYKNNFNEKDIEILKGYEEIYNHIKHRNMAIRDDYTFWALHDEKSEYGKVLVMNESDTNTQQIFFDDCSSYVLNARDIHNPQRHIPFEEIDGVHAFHANSYEIMINDDYFIESLIKAQKQFAQQNNI